MNRLIFFSVSLICFAGQGSAQSRFDQWDKDNSGTLTKEELPTPIQRNFERVDQNKDGVISKAEDAAFRNKNRPGGGKAAGIKKIADLDYSGADNPRQMLDLYLPEKPVGEKPLPLVVWIHGGAWQGGSKNNARFVTNLAASGKYAAASVGYRLTDEAQWPAQIHDCKAAIRWLKANAEKYGYDADKIAVWGSSAGGHLVAMLGVSHGVPELEGKIGPHLEQSSEVACVVDYYGPTELAKMNEQGSSMDHDAATSPEGKLIGGALPENLQAAKAASPIYYVTKDDESVLIVHGTKDPLVPHQQSVDFEKALEKAGVEAVRLEITNGEHGGGFPPEVVTIVEQYLEFKLLGTGELPADKVLEGVEIQRKRR